MQQPQQPQEIGADWSANLQAAHEFIAMHHRLPSAHSRDWNEKKLSRWISATNNDFKQQRRRMKYAEYRTTWNGFAMALIPYTAAQSWLTNLAALREFMITNGHIPSRTAADAHEAKCGQFWTRESHKYRQGHMTQSSCRAAWIAFVNEMHAANLVRL